MQEGPGGVQEKCVRQHGGGNGRPAHWNVHPQLLQASGVQSKDHQEATVRLEIHGDGNDDVQLVSGRPLDPGLSLHQSHDEGQQHAQARGEQSETHR